MKYDTLPPQVQKAVEWLVKEIESQQFADVGIKLTLHDSKIVRVEKTISEKEKP